MGFLPRDGFARHITTGVKSIAHFISIPAFQYQSACCRLPTERTESLGEIWQTSAKAVNRPRCLKLLRATGVHCNDNGLRDDDATVVDFYPDSYECVVRPATGRGASGGKYCPLNIVLKEFRLKSVVIKKADDRIPVAPNSELCLGVPL